MLRALLRRPAATAAVSPGMPAGRRVYAIGDIHGRLDLLENILARIDADDAARGPADTQLIFLGDVIDRGPDSAGVVERLRRLAADRPGTQFLLGNHEEVFLAAMAGDTRALRGFARIGGRETALSYGLDPVAYEKMSYDELFTALEEAVPQAHLAFLAGFEDLVVLGDYMFVHAGVDPDTALDAQRPADLRWIRDRFLNHRGQLGKVIVHGHTIRPEVERRPHRIGIDTGGYETDRLTALGLEATEQWTLQT